MEINKLNFEQIKSDNITNSFEELDVNADGKINEEDKKLAENQDIKNQIQQLLSSDVDDDPILEIEDTLSVKAAASEPDAILALASEVKAGPTEEPKPWVENPTPKDIRNALQLPSNYKIEITSQDDSTAVFWIFDENDYC